MKLEVGMYVYSKSCRDYGIGKITNITEGGQGFKGDLIDVQYKYSKHAIENYDVVASFNIIDLIEAKDLVEIEYYSPRHKERITRLFEIELKKGNNISFINAHCQLYFVDGDWCNADKILEPIIKSILTKEQFGSMEYRIGE